MTQPLLLLLLLTTYACHAQAQVANRSGDSAGPVGSFRKPLIHRINAGIGTNGVQVGVAKQVSARGLLNVSVSYRFFNSSLGHKWKGEKINTSYDMRTWMVGASYDWFPYTSGSHSAFVKALKIKGGIQYVFQPRYQFYSRAGGDINVSGYTYTPEEFGTVHTTVSTGRLQPFVCAGIDRFFAVRNFSLGGDLGVLYHGKPRVDIKADHMVESVSSQAGRLQRNLRDYRFFPYAELSFRYHL